MRSFRDRDHLITPEGFIFVVIGNLHPPDRVIAYLKYVPDTKGRWGRGQSRYRRTIEHYNARSVADSMRFLRENASQYVFESDIHGITLPAVPTDRIGKHLHPEEKLQGLRSARGRDELENKALRLAEFVSENAGIPGSALGLTGSLLAGIHDVAFSDVDLVVYGADNAVRAKNLFQTLSEPASRVQRLDGVSKDRWVAERLKSTPLTREQAIELLARKWNIGLFDSRDFSVHAVHTEREVRERYGYERYVSLGIIEATAKVSDSSKSLFMPAVYGIEPIKLNHALSQYEVDRIVSFEGLYADIAGQGEMVSCRGKLEKVECSSGTRYRIVVGTSEAQGTDYLLPSALA